MESNSPALWRTVAGWWGFVSDDYDDDDDDDTNAFTVRFPRTDLCMRGMKEKERVWVCVCVWCCNWKQRGEDVQAEGGRGQ